MCRFSAISACSAHWATKHPWPDPAGWDGLADGLDELYRWYEQTESMLANILRDAELVDAVPDAMKPLLDFLERARRALAAGRPRRKTVTAAIALAVDFRTWRSLVRHHGLRDDEAVELMVALAEAAAGGHPAKARRAG